MTYSYRRTTVDFVVIGGGIFGVYAALHLARQGRSGLLIEREQRLLRRASLVNQARLHGGYHYPRSVATAQSAQAYQQRFLREHHAFIHTDFIKYYAIDRFGSLTDRLQFERFCDYIGASYQAVSVQPPFDKQRIAALFQTIEHSFDPILLGQYYTQQLHKTRAVTAQMGASIKKVARQGQLWQLEIEKDQQRMRCETPLVINATYAGTNAVHQLFGVSPIHLQYELSEMVLLSMPQFTNRGLTIMDGQFGSLMPYGQTGLHSLSTVAYTHHEQSNHLLPTLSCQARRRDCLPHQLANCNSCTARPSSNFEKMRSQMQQYFSAEVSFHFYQSLFTVKSKLRSHAIDDGRPTSIIQLSSTPDFYCIFAGKVQSIYEIERVWSAR
ncbi:MAG: FAD-dependent oxidoreductase [Bacteroidota bacterium]